jgi:hypothetical protein
MINEQIKPSSEDIRCTFIQGGHYVDCYIHYDSNGIDRCHVYSLPFSMEHIRIITYNFPGGTFINIRVLRIIDFVHSFEQASSIIEYSRLTELIFSDEHIDDVEQFLSNLNTCLPCLSKLHVEYEHLRIVTENFKRNATRTNCAKVIYITFHHEIEMRHLKDFSPLL